MEIENLPGSAHRRGRYDRWINACKIILPTILATSGDMLRFPFATLYLTTQLNAPEAGGIIALRQNLGFVPAVVGFYAVSNLLGVAVGEERTPAEEAAIRRAADLLSFKVGAVASVVLLALAFTPFGNAGAENAVVRNFFLTYFPGAIPALLVIIRQENLLASRQPWVLTGINGLSLLTMAGMSYGLTEVLGSFGPGLGFTLSSLISLGYFERFLIQSSAHRNGWLSPSLKTLVFQRMPAFTEAKKALSGKAWHSALLYVGSTLGFWSTFLVPYMKEPDAQNIANGALNQLYFFLMVIGAQICQILVAQFMGGGFGKLKKEAGSAVLDRSKFLDKAKKSFKEDLVLIQGASLIWPLFLTALLSLFKTPAIRFLSREKLADESDVMTSVNSALPYVIGSGIVSSLTNTFFTAKRTLDGESRWDSALQIVAGVLTFGVVAAIIFVGDPSEMKDIWIPMFWINYVIPFVGAFALTMKHINQMEYVHFISDTELSVLPAVGEDLNLRPSTHTDQMALLVGPVGQGGYDERPLPMIDPPGEPIRPS